MSKIPKVVSFDRSPAYLHHRAMLNRRENHNVDALELMRRAVEAQPENREYALDLAELYCELGCHRQSSRLLLDMLSRGDAPSECFYGLALNQLGMNDIDGARQSLNIYRRREPQGAHSEDVTRLREELDFYTSANRPANRRLNRAMCVANRACEALKEGDAAKACRLFEKTLSMASEQYEMRALYAMSLAMIGNPDAARREAERAVDAYPPSVRALCVSAQVLHLLGEVEASEALLERAEAERPGGNELRLMLYTAGELGMHARAAEFARLAMQETPYDRDLLHLRAVALMKSGVDPAEAARCWARILRLDPEDSVAQYHLKAAESGALDPEDLEYVYEVPQPEYARRLETVSAALTGGFDALQDRWRDDAEFRALLKWAVCAEDTRLSHAAMTALATLRDEDARSVLRETMFSPDVAKGLKLHAAVMMKLQDRALSEIIPKPLDSLGEALVDAEGILEDMSVGDRQLVRYADEVLEDRYGVSARQVLALMWQSYRGMRGTRGDPLKRVDAAAGALACAYLMATGEKPNFARLSRAFGCPVRQLVFYASRMADRFAMKETEEKT